MRHYVTGANGFIGKHVVKYLQSKGHEVIPVKRHISSHLRFFDATKEFVFIHLGAYGNHYDQRDINETIKANILDLETILGYCKSEACVKLYNISTSSIQLPKQTLYSVSKHFGELMVEACNDERFVNVRPYSVYGPGEASHRFIPTVIRALRSGEIMKLDRYAVHDWIYIDDFIDAMFSGYTSIGTGESYDNENIVFALQEISGKKLNYTPHMLRNYDTKDWVCESGVPHRDIMQGLRLTYLST